MSIRLDSAAEGLVRTTNLPSALGPFTMMAWYYRSVNQVGNTDEILLSFGSATTNQIYEPYLNNNALALWDGSVLTQPGVQWSVGVWRHFALRRQASGLLSVVVNGAEYLSVNPVNVPTERLLLGNNSPFGEYWNGRITAFKAWDAYLTTTQITAEMNYWGAVYLTDLNATCPLQNADNLNDSSGNGNHFTSFGGTLTTEADPLLGLPFMAQVGARRVR